MSEIMVLRSALKQSAYRVGARLRSIKRCWAAAERVQSKETKARFGRPRILNWDSKIVISKYFLDNEYYAKRNRKVLEL